MGLSEGTPKVHTLQGGARPRETASIFIALILAGFFFFFSPDLLHISMDLSLPGAASPGSTRGCGDAVDAGGSSVASQGIKSRHLFQKALKLVGVPPDPRLPFSDLDYLRLSPSLAPPFKAEAV